MFAHYFSAFFTLRLLMHLSPSISFQSFLINFMSLKMLLAFSLNFVNSFSAFFFMELAMIFIVRLFVFLYLALFSSKIIYVHLFFMPHSFVALLSSPSYTFLYNEKLTAHWKLKQNCSV